MTKREYRALVIEIAREELAEFKKKRVIRKGKIKRKLDCPTAMKAVGGTCVRLDPKEKRKRKLGAKKGSKKRLAQKSRIARKRTKSLKKRQRLGL